MRSNIKHLISSISPFLSILWAKFDICIFACKKAQSIFSLYYFCITHSSFIIPMSFTSQCSWFTKEIKNSSSIDKEKPYSYLFCQHYYNIDTTVTRLFSIAMTYGSPAIINAKCTILFEVLFRLDACKGMYRHYRDDIGFNYAIGWFYYALQQYINNSINASDFLTLCHHFETLLYFFCTSQQNESIIIHTLH
jgi:hypothetical protein